MPNPQNKIPWSHSMIEYLKENYHLKNDELCKHLNLKKTVVRLKCYELGLKKMEIEHFTDWQINYLKKHYKKMGDIEIAEVFEKRCPKNKPWTKKHIEKKRKYLNLKRTKEQLFSIYQRNKKAGAWAMCSIKAWQTRGGATPVGEFRIWKIDGRNIVHIKTVDGFVWYSRYLWEQHFGAVPENMMVRIKDNNTLNIVIENLELVDKTENQKRNVAIRMAKNPELRRANYLIKQINKKVKNYEQQQQQHSST